MNTATILDLPLPQTHFGPSDDRVSDDRVSNADCELTRRIDVLTFRQVRDLDISQKSGRVVLNGRAKSYYVKQLATHAVLDLMPGAAVDNAIRVIQ